MRHMRFSGWLMLAACLTASGCSSSDQEELQTWMAQERANAKPRVKPLEEPKTFTPEAYLGSDGMDPFNPMKLMQVLRRESAQSSANTSLIASELNRRKEPLEAEPLDAMRSEEHTSELQSQSNLVCRLLLEKQKHTLPPLPHPPP